jgi:hypothetical protein
MGLPVLAVATVTLTGVHNQNIALPPIPAGTVFWADTDELPGLIAAGKATAAPPGTPYPQPLSRTARGWPGLGAATANSSP